MSVVKTILKIILIIILILVIAIAGGLAYLTLNEYNPEAEENLKIYGLDNSEYEGNAPKVGYAFNIMTWNIGYGALGDNADFFMDGGTGVRTADEERVNSNIANIVSQIKYHHPNIVLLQEVDRDSDRSYHLDEAQRIASNIPEKIYTFAKNYDSIYVPYPWPPIGKVESGLLTLSDYEITEAERYQLPIPFSWPVRIANLKRCLAVNRIPVDGTDKELVIINLHLEAYDSGEGKAAQTKMLNTILQNEVTAGNYVIAGGDFNQIFSSVDNSEYPTLEGMWQCGKIDEDEFDESLQFIMDNRVPSCRSLDKPYAGADHDPSVFQYYIIDGFIVSSNINVVSFETKDMGFQYTDHNPVLMRVKLLA